MGRVTGKSLFKDRCVKNGQLTHKIPSRAQECLREAGDQVAVEFLVGDEIERNPQCRRIVLRNRWGAAQRALWHIETFMARCVSVMAPADSIGISTGVAFAFCGKSPRTSVRYFSVGGITIRMALTSFDSSARRASAGARFLNATFCRSGYADGARQH